MNLKWLVYPSGQNPFKKYHLDMPQVQQEDYVSAWMWQVTYFNGEFWKVGIWINEEEKFYCSSLSKEHTKLSQRRTTEPFFTLQWNIPEIIDWYVIRSSMLCLRESVLWILWTTCQYGQVQGRISKPYLSFSSINC